MSTHSMIMYQRPDGAVTSVYCHFDGYLSHNGDMLLENYNDDESVRRLLENGDMSYLEETPEQSCYYGRDRGESDTGPNHFSSLDEAMLWGSEEYTYLYVAGHGWWVKQMGEQWQDLGTALTPYS